jgi:N-acetylglutamate synthase-like GNAT family acetyltransferase
MEIRKAQPEEYEKIARFYVDTGYTPAIRQEDDFWLAEDSGKLVGVARLCREEDVLVLRGMQVVGGMQRKGIGTALLNAITPFVGENECFCIPYQDLVSFYGQTGFVEVDVEDCPRFLADRASDYNRKFDRGVVIMRKPRGVSG